VLAQECWVAEQVPRERPPRERVAYHEAGHAVVGVAVGRVLGDVSLETGTCTFTSEDPLDAVVASAFAGAVADARGMGSYSDSAGAFDQFNAEGLARAKYPGETERDAYLRRMAKRAVALVDEHWPAIERLAAYLLERGGADGAEVRRLVG
jgi:hypothetical protein